MVSHVDYDSPWKEILEQYFPQFLAFFFPHVEIDIDWGRPYEFLDKELQQVVRDAETGNRRVDKLVQVWRKDGDEIWVLIHIEVQGQVETLFPRRMYVYNYRLFDRYDRQVASLAVLTDEDPQWRPDHFGYDLWGSRVSLHFPTAKILDFREQWAQLEADLNPFAVVVMAHLKTQETRRDPDARRHWKFSLTRMLYERGYSRQDILDLFRFIDWVMILPPELEQQFEADLNFYEEQRTMRYVTTIERRAEERGLEQGIEQGIEKGIEQGTIRMLRANIVDALRIRFGEVTPALVERISALDEIQLLQTLFRQSLTTLTLAEFEQALTDLLASDQATDQ